jgi:hypothetical protein
MKFLKQTDLAISIILITGFSAWYIYNQEILFTAYFITGGWQVLSMIVHEVMGWFTGKGSGRRVYHLISGVIILLGVLAPFIYIFFFIYLIMLFAAPVMAVIYSFICYNEIKSLQSRPLTKLK